MALQLIAVLLLACAASQVLAFPTGQYELDEYDQRVMDGLCPMVDCMMMDMLLHCPWPEREPVYFLVGEYICRGCMRCRDAVEPTVETSSEEEEEEDEVREDSGENHEGKPTTVATPKPTTAPGSGVAEVETTVAEMDSTTEEVTMTTPTSQEEEEKEEEEEEEEEEAVVVEEEEEEEEQGSMAGRIKKLKKLSGAAWVDDSDILSLGDDQLMLEEFLNDNDEVDTQDEAEIVRALEKAAAGMKHQSKTGAAESSTEGSVNDIDVSDDAEEDRSRVVLHCPLLDCAVIEYMLTCQEQDREPTYWTRNGVRCPGCRQCRSS